MRIPVLRCARCGQDHAEVEFDEFERPVVVNGQVLEFYGLCPTTHQPILMQVVVPPDTNTELTVHGQDPEKH